ncbi:MAG TPA: ribosome maturation factor RimM [Propionibacteriaceae bacterium]|nr:ribosome maturation factor RimM [Propionibacteriaceae bacterium]
MTVEVVVGVVGRPHGVRGEVAVEPRTDEPDRRFAPGQQLRSEGSPRTWKVASMRWHSGRMLVRFAGLDDRTAAEAVRGIRLVTDVDPDERPKEPGEYYDRQLVGLGVQTADGVRVGEVVDVLHLPAQDLLEVRTANGLRLVPFVADLVPEIDLENRMVTVADRDGLLAESSEG